MVYIYNHYAISSRGPANTGGRAFGRENKAARSGLLRLGVVQSGGLDSSWTPVVCVVICNHLLRNYGLLQAMDDCLIFDAREFIFMRVVHGRGLPYDICALKIIRIPLQRSAAISA
jgi:hypothetical protein